MNLYRLKYPRISEDTFRGITLWKAFREQHAALWISNGTQAAIRERRARKLDPLPTLLDGELRRQRNRAKRQRRAQRG